VYEAIRAVRQAGRDDRGITGRGVHHDGRGGGKFLETPAPAQEAVGPVGIRAENDQVDPVPARGLHCLSAGCGFVDTVGHSGTSEKGADRLSFEGIGISNKCA
jgi:hypothetical protein